MSQLFELDDQKFKIMEQIQSIRNKKPTTPLKKEALRNY